MPNSKVRPPVRKYPRVMDRLKEVLKEKGQYMDVWYLEKDGTWVEKRCLVIPAKDIEPLIEKETIGGKNELV